MITLSPTKTEQYVENIKLAKLLYGSELYKYGEVGTTQKALEIGTSEINALLPDGFATDHNYFMNIVYDDQIIGFIWYRIEPKGSTAHLCFIYIGPDFRGIGYGEKSMVDLIGRLKGLGYTFLTLLVFLFNLPAVKLYEKLGFQILKKLKLHESGNPTRYQMTLKL